MLNFLNLLQSKNSMSKNSMSNLPLNANYSFFKKEYTSYKGTYQTPIANHFCPSTTTIPNVPDPNINKPVVLGLKSLKNSTVQELFPPNPWKKLNVSKLEILQVRCLVSALAFPRSTLACSSSTMVSCGVHILVRDSRPARLFSPPEDEISSLIEPLAWFMTYVRLLNLISRRPGSGVPA